MTCTPDLLPCPYGFPNDGESCCGGYCAMEGDAPRPKLYTEAEVQAMVGAAYMDASGAAIKELAVHGVSDLAPFVHSRILAISPDATAALAAHVAEAVNEERERCARIARESEDVYGLRNMHDMAKCARNIAAAIRALKSEPKP